jgi:ribosomal-protein-alanine N-acetyltransferase
MRRGPTIATPRLILRRWVKEDLRPFVALNADPAVMEHFPTTIDEAETAILIARFELTFEEHGFGIWAVEIAWARTLIGFCGLLPVEFDAPFTPAVEIGWRFAHASWGNGYATEAAEAAMTHGFDVSGLDEIVSFTVPANVRSRRVMERLGMRRDPNGDFDHPRLPNGDPLRPHVLYRMSAAEWALRDK